MENNIQLSEMEQAVAKALTHHKNQGQSLSIVYILDDFIRQRYDMANENEMQVPREVTWNELESYLNSLQKGSSITIPLVAGFCYEVLKWSDMLEVLQPIIPERILYFLQNQCREDTQGKLFNSLVSLCIWGENPYILTLMASVDSSKVEEYRARIQVLDPFLAKTKEYCLSMKDKGLIGLAQETSLKDSGILRADVGMLQLPGDVVRIVASKFFSDGYPRTRALADLRSLKGTCRKMRADLAAFKDPMYKWQLQLHYKQHGFVQGDTVWMWGYSLNIGQNRSPIRQSMPLSRRVQIRGLPIRCQVLELQIGDHTSGCIVANSGRHEIWMWGDNYKRQLGVENNNDNYHYKGPVRVEGLPNGARLLQLQLGEDHSGCLLEVGGNREIWMWGENFSGQLGKLAGFYQNNKFEPGYNPRPGKVEGLPQGSRVVQLRVAGQYNGCILEIENHREVWMWGYNQKGQLGNGNRESQCHPVKVELPNGARALTLQLSSGSRCRSDLTACLLDMGGNHEVWVWGGEFQEHPNRPNPTPRKMEGLPAGARVLQLQLYYSSAACLLENVNGEREVWVWWHDLGNEQTRVYHETAIKFTRLPDGVVLQLLPQGCVLEIDGECQVWYWASPSKRVLELEPFFSSGKIPEIEPESSSKCTIA